MCLIAVCQTRKMKPEEIVAANSCNGHGIGMAWIDNGRIRYEKGMDLAAFNELYSTFKKFPHVIHFRLASSGGVIPELTHPFIVSKNSPIRLTYDGKLPVLFHNGVVSSWEEKLLNHCIADNKRVPDGPMSDTRAVAIIANTLGPNMFDHESGKWVLVTTKGINVYGASRFEKDDGILYSNSSYQSRSGVCSIVTNALVNTDWSWIRNKTTQVTLSKEHPKIVLQEKRNGHNNANHKKLMKKGDYDEIYNDDFWETYYRWKNENQ